MIVNLIRSDVAWSQPGEMACQAEAAGVPPHRVVAKPFEDAEAEVRRRVLRSLADRVNPPTAVLFVRTWELPLQSGPAEPAAEPAPREVEPSKRRGRRG
jgi:hypothetical protein